MHSGLKKIVYLVLASWLVLSSICTLLFFEGVFQEEKDAAAQKEPTSIPIPSKLSKETTQSVYFDPKLNIEAKTNDLPLFQKFSTFKNNQLGKEIQRQYPNQTLSVPSSGLTQLQADFEPIYQNWPRVLKTVSEQYIHTIVVVKDLPSSALVLEVKHSDQFVILLNESVLHKKPNEWMAEIEANNFTYSYPEESIRFVIETEQKPILTLENILIHELGHVFGVVQGISNNFDHFVDIQKDFPFFKKSFKGVLTFKPTSKYSNDFALLGYYNSNKEKLSFSDYYTLTQRLEETPYPTLYASRNEMEFFAEMFYSYVHCIVQNKPYSVYLTDKKEITTEFKNGIYSERCAYEKNFIARFFQ